MIDYERAHQIFETYLDGYDRKDDKIRLKIVHTYAVVECAQKIAARMGLPEEDTELAKLIGLLHDIGRFEQVKQFDSFQPDTMDHAAFGVEILFGQKKMIRRFIEEEGYDEVIRTAIAKHSDFVLEGIEDEKMLLHARLIRDADKLDNCRVKLEEDMVTLLGIPEEAAGKGSISSKVWEACMNRRSVLSADRVTTVDYWTSYLAQYYDVNFPETFVIMKEENYIPRIAYRLDYPEKETAVKIEKIVQMLCTFMDERIAEGKKESR